MTHNPHPADVTIGKNICAARKRHGYSMDNLAQLIGVSFQQVQKYEKATNRVSCSMLVHISVALETPVEDFFGEYGYVDYE